MKLPLGLLALALAGGVLAFGTRKWPGVEPLLVLALFACLLLAMLMTGASSYAGIRHGLIVLFCLRLLAPRLELPSFLPRSIPVPDHARDFPEEVELLLPLKGFPKS